MSRETYYNSPPKKYFRGEDMPHRTKRAHHLVTYSNFLVADEDHSKDRPFHMQDKPTLKKSLELTKNSSFEPVLETAPAKKFHDRSNDRFASSYNFLEHNSLSSEWDDKVALNKRPERYVTALNTVSAPVVDEDIKPNRKVLNIAQQSYGVRMSLNSPY